MNFSEIEKTLTEIVPSEGYGIDRFYQVLKNYPDLITLKPSNIILVAGTNGKGTVSSLITHGLTEAGKKVGLFTSPHLIHPNERIRRGLTPIDENEYIEAFNANISLINHHKLSHFESHLLMALWCFRHNIDDLVLEVGLGGTYDATNAIPHSYCVFTEFGIDHQNILGSSLSEIIDTKMGIIDQSINPIVISYPLPKEGIPLVTQNTKRKNAKYIFTKNHTSINTDWKNNKQTIEWDGQTYFLPNATTTYTKCVQLALQVLKVLKVKTHPNTFISYDWPGRFEKLEVQEKTIILDIAHNEQAIKNLALNLKSFCSKKPLGVVAFSKGKDVEKLLKILKPMCSNIILTPSPFKPQKYQTYNDIAYVETPEKAFQLALQKDNFILITGSSFLVGAFKKWRNHRDAVI